MYDYVLEEMAEAVAKELRVDHNEVLSVLSRYWQDKIAPLSLVQHMLECALNAAKPIPPVDAAEVLQDVLHHHDASLGINWTCLEVKLENYQLEFKTLPLDEWKKVYGVFKVWRENESNAREFGAFPDHVKGNLSNALEYAMSQVMQNPDAPVFVAFCSQLNRETQAWLTVILESGDDEPSILEG